MDADPERMTTNMTTPSDLPFSGWIGCPSECAALAARLDLTTPFEGAVREACRPDGTIDRARDSWRFATAKLHTPSRHPERNAAMQAKAAATFEALVAACLAAGVRPR